MRRWSRRLVLKRSSGAAGKAGAGGAYSRDFELGRDSGGSIHVPVSAGTAPRLWLRRDRRDRLGRRRRGRSEEHTSELQSLMRISYAVFCLKKKKHTMKSSHMDNSI